MAEPFLSEIRIMSFVFAPKGWALCNGQLLPINQNQALFSLLGTTYGGDGAVNFALPDLRGRVPIHVGEGHTLGERGGEQAHTLSIAELPTHTHVAAAASHDTHGNQPDADGNVLGARRRQPLYGAAEPRSRMDPSTVAERRRQPGAPNMQPFLTLNFCIALQGIFPSPELRRRIHGTALCWRDPHVCRQLRAGRLDVLRGAAAADLGERNAVQLIGTTYGGDGQSTFALPDLRGRIPIHQGNGFILAETGGAEEITLTVNQIPAHTHPLLASTNIGDAAEPGRQRARAARRRCRLRHRTSPDLPTGAQRRVSPSAAASRTPTSSPTSASTSSSRCSASSRRQT